MTGKEERLPASTTATQQEVDSFLAKLARTPSPSASGQRGRLVFAMDATASREPTWDRACQLQAEMFEVTHALGGLDVQLVFYRGFRECKASPWVSDSMALLQRMTAVRCLGGHTQIRRVLGHTVNETKRRKVNALVFVGDCFEEDPDDVCHRAGELGLLGVPAFMFHEGHDPVARRVFQQIAQLTGGAFCRFDASSAGQLRDLLSAVAVYAAGGLRALADFSDRRGGDVRQLTYQVGRK